MGNLATLTTDRLNVDPFVRMVTTRTFPSLPGCTSMIRPNAHFAGGWLSSMMRTRSPMATLSVVDCHLRLCCNVCKYSADQRFQKR